LFLCTGNVNCLLALVALARLHIHAGPWPERIHLSAHCRHAWSRCRLHKQQIGLTGCVQVAAAHSTHRAFSCHHVLKHMDASSLSPSVPKCSVGMMFLNWHRCFGIGNSSVPTEAAHRVFYSAMHQQSFPLDMQCHSMALTAHVHLTSSMRVSLHYWVYPTELTWEHKSAWALLVGLRLLCHV